MQALPPPDNDTFTTLLRALTAGVLGMIGASFSSLDRAVKGKEMFWHLGLSLFLSGLTFCTLVSIWPGIYWIVWLLPSFVIGFCVYGIAVALKKNSKSAEDFDVTKVIKKKTGIEGD